MAEALRQFACPSQSIHLDCLRGQNGGGLHQDLEPMRSLRTPDGRRARVLHVGKFYPPYKGGMETHLQDLCRAIAPFADVSVVVSNNGRRKIHELDGDIPVERSASWANIASAPICPGMVRAIRNARADIVHLHCPNPMAVVSCLASRHSG